MPRKSNALYIAKTDDEYELPLAVFDSPTELAAWAGIKVDSLNSALSNAKAGRLRHCKYERVEM